MKSIEAEHVQADSDAPMAILEINLPVDSELPLVISGVHGRYRVTRVDPAPGYPTSCGPIHLEKIG